MPAAYSGVPELVVPAALGVVAEYFVRLGALLEMHLGVRLVLVVAVGVVLHRQAAVGALDLLARSRPLNPQHLVIVTFGGCHVHPTLYAPEKLGLSSVSLVTEVISPACPQRHEDT